MDQDNSSNAQPEDDLADDTTDKIDAEKKDDAAVEDEGGNQKEKEVTTKTPPQKSNDGDVVDETSNILLRRVSDLGEHYDVTLFNTCVLKNVPDQVFLDPSHQSEGTRRPAGEVIRYGNEVVVCMRYLPPEDGELSVFLCCGFVMNRRTPKYTHALICDSNSAKNKEREEALEIKICPVRYLARKANGKTYEQTKDAMDQLVNPAVVSFLASTPSAQLNNHLVGGNKKKNAPPPGGALPNLRSRHSGGATEDLNNNKLGLVFPGSTPSGQNQHSLLLPDMKACFRFMVEENKKMLTTWSGNFAQAAAGAMQQCMKTTMKDTMKKTFQPFNNNVLSLKNELSKMNSSLSVFNKKNIKEQQHQQKLLGMCMSMAQSNNQKPSGQQVQPKKRGRRGRKARNTSKKRNPTPIVKVEKEEEEDWDDLDSSGHDSSEGSSYYSDDDGGDSSRKIAELEKQLAKERANAAKRKQQHKAGATRRKKPNANKKVKALSRQSDTDDSPGIDLAKLSDKELNKLLRDTLRRRKL